MRKLVSTLVIIAWAMLSVTVYAQKVTPSSHYVTKEVDVAKFNAISLFSIVDVIYTQSSSKQKVEIYAPDNLVGYIDVFVEDGELKVGLKPGKKSIQIEGDAKMEVRVSAPAVNKLSISSVGNLFIENNLNLKGMATLYTSSCGNITGKDISCGDLKVMSSSTGSITMGDASCGDLEVGIGSTGGATMGDVSCGALNVNITSTGDAKMGEVSCSNLIAMTRSTGGITIEQVKTTTVQANASSTGSISIADLKATKISASSTSCGDITLAGTCNEASYKVTSTGSIKAKEMKATDVVAITNSVGSVECYVTGQLKAEATSVGEVFYKGDPKQIDFTPKEGLRKID